MKSKYKGIIIVFSMLFLVETGSAFNGTGSITSGGITRTFVFHAPGTSVGTNLPVMFVFHGDGGSGAGIKGYTTFDAVADAQNFIVVYPDAVSSTWNRYVDNVPGDAGLGNSSAPDDVQFTSDLIDYFCTTYHINSHKVYASGHSAGGFMCYNLAIRLPAKIAAFAPVSASLWGDNTYINTYFANAYVPVPIYHIHGDNDNTVTYPDADQTPTAWSEWPLSGFGDANCGASTYSASTFIVGSSVKKLTFCNAGLQVLLIDIVGGGHGWPSVSGYDASMEIWNFCNTYSLTTTTNCNLTTGVSETLVSPLYTVFPNPTEGPLTILIPDQELGPNTIAQLTDVSGKEILTNLITGHNMSLNISTLENGMYLLKVIKDHEVVSAQKIILNK